MAQRARSMELFDHASYPDLKLEPGFYWWFCEPGGIPGSPPVGPFDSPQQARNDYYSMFEGVELIDPPSQPDIP